MTTRNYSLLLLFVVLVCITNFSYSQSADSSSAVNEQLNATAQKVNGTKDGYINRIKNILSIEKKQSDTTKSVAIANDSISNSDTTKVADKAKGVVSNQADNIKSSLPLQTDSTSGVMNNAADKAKNIVSENPIVNKVSGLNIKQDSSVTLKEKAVESPAVKSLTDRFQTVKADTGKLNSFNVKEKANSSYFDLKEKADLKGKSNNLKQGLVTRKESLIAKKNGISADSLKPKVVAYAKKQVKEFNPKGSIAVGYEYGVLPSVVGASSPTGGYRTEGQLTFNLLGLPLQAAFHYTNIKNVVGINNYFKISYDANQYKEQMAQKLNIKNQVTQTLLTTLQAQQQQLLQQMDFTNMYSQSFNFQNPLNGNYNLNGLNYNSLNLNGINSLTDTSGLMSGLNYNQYLNGLNQYQNIDTSNLSIDQIQYLQKQDSLNQVMATNKAKYDSINQLIADAQNQLNQIKNLQNNPAAIDNPYLSKVQNFMSHVKKLEIGMCNPNYSMFLVNNIPLQGINLEFEKNNNFFAVTYGTTMNNLLFNTNTLQGSIQGARNLYNYFDFGNLSAGRKILSVKGGVGAKEKSHLYIGALIGKGKSDYTSLSSDPSNSLIESNLVLELDGKYVFNEQASIDVLLGKSTVREEDISMAQISKAIDEVFSPQRSNAISTKINYDVKKTNTKLTVATRWIDPYFKSFGLGFMRSDNLRYEIKAEQPITKKIKYTVAYKREEDNLLKLLAYKNTLQTINNTLSIRFKKGVNVRLIYAPLFREFKTADFVRTDKNHIATAVVSYVPKWKKVSAQFNTLYSRYIITGDSANINFENFTCSNQLQFKSGLKTAVSMSWFKDNLRDSLNNDTYLSVAEVGYVSEKTYSVSLGGKMACKKNIEPQFGFIARASIKLYKGLSFEAEAEKIIIGDYYNAEMVEQIKNFPFYFNNKLIYTF